MRIAAVIAYFLITLLPNCSLAQSGIEFIEGLSLDDVLTKATKENKNVFVDTYTKWCLPCKNLDMVFTDKALGDYFNSHFINTKFDMEAAIGKELQLKYDVVFVPTLLILDKNGYTVIRFETGNITATDLLRIGKSINGPLQNEIVTAQPSAANSQNKQVDPFVASKKVETKEDKIVYVLGDHTHATPDLLRQEAYFRLQLMDGTHKPLVKKYLETQDNWLKPEVMQFIYDFLYTTDSPTFSFVVENKSAFEKLFGTESLIQTLSILIDKKLYQAVPRPTFDEAKALYKVIYPLQAEYLANQYLLSRGT